MYLRAVKLRFDLFHQILYIRRQIIKVNTTNFYNREYFYFFYGKKERTLL